MKRSLAALALLLLVSATALAHAGHMHTYMGVVEAVHANDVVVKTVDGKSLTLPTSPATTYAHADGSAAARGDLAAGMRVVIKMALDGKTAANVKMGAK